MIVRQKFRYAGCLQQQLMALFLSNQLIWLADQGQEVIGIYPKSLLVLESNHSARHHIRSLDLQSVTDERLDFLDFRELIHFLTSSSANLTTPKIAGFCGGLMGFVGYDVAAALAQNVPIQGDQPKAVLGIYDVFFRLESGEWWLYGPSTPAHLTLYQQIDQRVIQAIASQATLTFQLLHPLMPRWSFSQYAQAFGQVQDYLKAGDCYQVNLTQAFDGRMTGDLLPLLESLMTLTRAPFAGYLRCGDLELLSCSPELFIALEDQQTIVTRPIKGTRPRLADPVADEASKAQLIASDKDRSENLMIVDLLRNDLSIHAKVGSVHVPKLFEIESFAQVHHMVSEIRATLTTDQSALQVVMDALPGGSITGAPKIRAMQIIDELEAGPRGAYCGSMGYLNADGTGRFNILIRTLQRVGQDLQIWAGGGITIASELESEYQECLDKIGAIVDHVNQWQSTTDPLDIPD